MTDFFEHPKNRERVRLVESDLALTNEFIKGVVATSASIRAAAFTLWLALLGFAFQQDLTALAVLGGAVASAFWVIDGYHGWLYSEATAHARACERLLSQYYDAISRGDDDPGVIKRFSVKLRAQRYGLFLSFRSGFGWAQWWGARPTILYRIIYPIVIAISIACITLIAMGGQDDHVDRGHEVNRGHGVIGHPSSRHH